MTKRSVMMLYTLLLILAFCLTLGSSSILAQDKDKPVNSGAVKGDAQSGLNRNPYRVAPNPVLTDPRDQVAVESGSLDVNLLLMRSQEPWASYSLSATQSDWNLRKPGNYAVKSLVGTVMGNVDVLISFAGFEDLSSANLPVQNLAAYYSASLLNLTVGQVVWYGAVDFNGQHLSIPPSPTDPVDWTLWNKVSMDSQKSSDEYTDDAVITFHLANTKTWTDGDSGDGL